MCYLLRMLILRYVLYSLYIDRLASYYVDVVIESLV